MSTKDITDNKNILTKTCSILLTVIFFILSFLTGFNNIAIFVLGILTLGLVVLLSYKRFKDNNYYALGILLIPLLSYGLINALSYYANAYYSVSTRIFIVINILLFVVAGYFSKQLEGFDFKLIFKGIFISLSIICLINLISTLVCFGPFYGLRIGSYIAYYDGREAKESIATSAYALCGFSIKQVPIEYYLLYPFLLLTSGFIFLFSRRRNLFDLISTCCFVIISLISLIFVISKIPLILIAIYLVFVCYIVLTYIFRNTQYRLFKYLALSFVILLAIYSIIFLINSQFNMEDFRNFISKTGFLDRLFNKNRYAQDAQIILNGVFTGEKLIGFPVYFDNFYLLPCVPSDNIIVNQFMYGGIFGFLFMAIMIAIFVYMFIQLRSSNIEDKEYKYFPVLFVVSYFVITCIADQNSFDMFDYTLIVANYLSPFFYISIFIIGHYYSLVNYEEKNNEK